MLEPFTSDSVIVRPDLLVNWVCPRCHNTHMVSGYMLPGTLHLTCPYCNAPVDVLVTLPKP